MQSIPSYENKQNINSIKVLRDKIFGKFSFGMYLVSGEIIEDIEVTDIVLLLWNMTKHFTVFDLLPPKWSGKS